ncbi:MAG: hypothetical protein ABII72_05255 [Parcubacteria group bacterium]
MKININKKYHLLLFFAFCVIFFSILQFSFPNFLGQDAYYHAKTAQLIAEKGELLQSFPWLQFTILKDQFVEHHLLLHLILIPFVTILPPILGGKIAAVLFAALMSGTFYWLLQKLEVKCPLLWSMLLLFSSSAFIFRLNLLRAQSLALIMLWLGIYAIVKQKKLLLLIIAFFYVWLFDGFFFLGLVTLAYFFANTISNPKKSKQILHSLIPLGLFIVGVLASILLNPYFPDNVRHLFFHLYRVALHNSFSNLPVGGEWTPASPFDLLKTSWPVLILYFTALTVTTAQLLNKRLGLPKKIDYFLLITTSGFLGLTLVAQRLIEYSAPFIVLLAAVVLGDFWQKNHSRFKNLLAQIRAKKKLKMSAAIIIIVALTGYGGYFMVDNIKNMRHYTKSYQAGFAEAATWLENNTPAQSTIFQVDWSDFPSLFFYNSDNYYVGGLDPNFMLEYDQNIFNKWNKIFHQEDLHKAYSIIKYDFNSDYVLVTEEFDKINEQAANDPRWENVYQSEEINIYHLKDY